MLSFLSVNCNMNKCLSWAVCPLCQQNSNEEKQASKRSKPTRYWQCPANPAAIFILHVYKQEENRRKCPFAPIELWEFKLMNKIFSDAALVLIGFIYVLFWTLVPNMAFGYIEVSLRQWQNQYNGWLHVFLIYKLGQKYFNRTDSFPYRTRATLKPNCWTLLRHLSQFKDSKSYISEWGDPFKWSCLVGLITEK